MPVALLFLLTLFRAPFATAIPGFVTAPALVSVACLMAQALRGGDWDEATDYVPAIIIALAMPFSIATGIGLAFATLAALKTIAGWGREVSGAGWLIAALCVTKFALS